MSFKEYKTDYIKVFSVILLCLVVVLGQVFSDAAHRPFWWKFWNVLQVVSAIAVIGGWAYMWATQGKKK